MKYEITGTTRLTGLLGSPVAHSISPQMHNEAFRALGLDYAYLAFDIDPKDLKQAVEGLKLLNIRGFNLTMPHKTAILDIVDTLTPAAILANAVNTVTVEDGKLIGHTTDGIGYMRSVEDAGFSIIGKKMTLLGAGGAATAICTQAALDGVTEIDMFKRKNASWESVLQFTKRMERQGKTFDMADLACSFQECALDEIFSRVRAVLDNHKDIRHFVVGGGVSANSRLREKVEELRNEYPEVEFTVPPMYCCTDNASMIGVAGTIAYLSGRRGDASLTADSSLEIQ